MKDKIGKYDNTWWNIISGIGLLGKRVADWCSPPNGPPQVTTAYINSSGRIIPTLPTDGCDCCEEKIIKLPKKHFIEQELDTLEQWAKEAESWSEDYVYVMGLIASIACLEKIPLKYRTRASAFIRGNIHEPIVATAVK